MTFNNTIAPELGTANLEPALTLSPERPVYRLLEGEPFEVGH